MLAALILTCALLAGYNMAERKHLNLLHSVSFALILAATVYVILDIEHPRRGMIKMNDSDQVLVDLRAGMR